MSSNGNYRGRGYHHRRNNNNRSWYRDQNYDQYTAQRTENRGIIGRTGSSYRRRYENRFQEESASSSSNNNGSRFSNNNNRDDNRGTRLDIEEEPNANSNGITGNSTVGNNTNSGSSSGRFDCVGSDANNRNGSSRFSDSRNNSRNDSRPESRSGVSRFSNNYRPNRSDRDFRVNLPERSSAAESTNTRENRDGANTSNAGNNNSSSSSSRSNRNDDPGGNRNDDDEVKGSSYGVSVHEEASSSFNSPPRHRRNDNNYFGGASRSRCAKRHKDNSYAAQKALEASLIDVGGPAYVDRTLCDDAIDPISQLQIWNTGDDGSRVASTEIPYLFSYVEIEPESGKRYTRGFAIESFQQLLLQSKKTMTKKMTHPVSGAVIPDTTQRLGEKMVSLLRNAGKIDVICDQDPTTWTLADIRQSNDPPSEIKKLAFSVFQAFYIRESIEIPADCILGLSLKDLKSLSREMKAMYVRNFDNQQKRQLCPESHGQAFVDLPYWDHSPLVWQFCILSNVHYICAYNPNAPAYLVKLAMYVFVAAIAGVCPSVRERYSDSFALDFDLAPRITEADDPDDADIESGNPETGGYYVLTREERTNSVAVSVAVSENPEYNADNEAEVVGSVVTNIFTRNDGSHGFRRNDNYNQENHDNHDNQDPDASMISNITESSSRSGNQQSINVQSEWQQYSAWHQSDWDDLAAGNTVSNNNQASSSSGNNNNAANTESLRNSNESNTSLNSNITSNTGNNENANSSNQNGNTISCSTNSGVQKADSSVQNTTAAFSMPTSNATHNTNVTHDPNTTQNTTSNANDMQHSTGQWSTAPSMQSSFAIYDHHGSESSTVRPSDRMRNPFEPLNDYNNMWHPNWIDYNLNHHFQNLSFSHQQPPRTFHDARLESESITNDFQTPNNFQSNDFQQNPFMYQSAAQHQQTAAQHASSQQTQQTSMFSLMNVIPPNTMQDVPMMPSSNNMIQNPMQNSMQNNSGMRENMQNSVQNNTMQNNMRQDWNGWHILQNTNAWQDLSFGYHPNP